MTSFCTGCVPRFQENQLAHMEPGGCLWCDHEENIEPFDFDQFLQDDIKSESTPDSVTVSINSLDKPETECCICYETINKNKNNCVTECGHVFCLKCLVTSFAHGNNSCPCCRTEMIEMPEEDDEEVNIIEDDDDYSEDTDGTDSTANDDDEIENYNDECDIEELTRRLKANSFDMKDILSMLIGRYTKDTTILSVKEMNKTFEKIIDEADNETMEQNLFALEDVRV